MKLNLLPTHVSKEGQSKIAGISSAVLALASIGAGIVAVGYSSDQLAKAKARVAEVQPAYEAAMATSKRADEIMASSIVIDRNVKLANAMMEHNKVYPDLYREVLSYVPSFFRVNSIAAAPANESTCTVTMTGVLQTYQQYADIMLAMLRIPGATNVTRAGFTDVRKNVPALNENDQIGLPVKPGEPNLPSDPLRRLDDMIARAGQAPTGYLNANGFGSNAPQKGAMPDWSQVTITVTLARNIMTPLPMATLKAQGGATGGGAPAPNSGGFTAPGPSGRGGPNVPQGKGRVGSEDFEK